MKLRIRNLRVIQKSKSLSSSSLEFAFFFLLPFYLKKKNDLFIIFPTIYSRLFNFTFFFGESSSLSELSILRFGASPNLRFFTGLIGVASESDRINAAAWWLRSWTLSNISGSEPSDFSDFSSSSSFKSEQLIFCEMQNSTLGSFHQQKT